MLIWLFPPAARFALIVLTLCVFFPLSCGYAIFGTGGLISVAVGLVTALYVYGDLPRRSVTAIPGPKKRWLVGNLPEFIKTGYHELYGQVTKEYGPVASLVVGARAQVVVADPDLIRQVCVTKFDYFQDRPSMTIRKNKGLFVAKGEHWKLSRRTLNPSFNSIQLSAFADTISHHCDALVRRLDRVTDKRDGGPVDMHRLYGDLTMDVIGSTSFDSNFELQELEASVLGDRDGEDVDDNSSSNESTGKSEKSKSKGTKIMEAAKFLFAKNAGPLGSGGALQKAVAVLFPFLVPVFLALRNWLHTDDTKELERHAYNLDTIMLEIVDGRSDLTKTSTTPAASDTNFIDLVRKARDPESGKGLDSEEVRDQLNLFVIAGYETTANTLSYITYLLTQHPEIEERLLQEIRELAPDGQQKLSFKDLAKFSYTSMVVDEALRLYPPGAMLAREALTDITIGGSVGSASSSKSYAIKKGTVIVIPVYSMHRDERFWENPEVFDPERFSPERSAGRSKYVYMPFGMGARTCIGQRFAIEEIKLAIISLYREHTFTLHKQTQVPLRLRAGLTLSPLDGIWVKVHRRKEVKRQ